MQRRIEHGRKFLGRAEDLYNEVSRYPVEFTLRRRLVDDAGRNALAIAELLHYAHRIFEWSLITCSFALAIIATVYGMK